MDLWIVEGPIGRVCTGFTRARIRVSSTDIQQLKKSRGIELMDAVAGESA